MKTQTKNRKIRLDQYRVNACCMHAVYDVHVRIANGTSASENSGDSFTESLAASVGESSWTTKI